MKKRPLRLTTFLVVIFAAILLQGCIVQGEQYGYGRRRLNLWQQSLNICQQGYGVWQQSYTPNYIPWQQTSYTGFWNQGGWGQHNYYLQDPNYRNPPSPRQIERKISGVLGGNSW